MKSYLTAIITFVLMFAIPSELLANPITIKKPVSRLNNIRALHFVLRMIDLDRAYWLVDQAKAAGFNTIVVTITDGVNLTRAPWKAAPNAWSREDLIKWVNYTNIAGLEFVPEIKLLTHQELFFQKENENLMFNTVTYDPRNELVYKKIFPLLDEIISIFHPRAIHIGHDEVARPDETNPAKLLPKNEKMLPDDLFLKDVITLNNYLKQKHVEAWIWGDMLIAPEEFPAMLYKHLHGTALGYGKSLRNKLPKDVVICDWHYFDGQTDYPSIAVMQIEGFKVLGATWKTEKNIHNFSRYTATHGGTGMIATTWSHVQRKEWDIVENIIRTSGAAFNKDFPDAK